MIVPMKKLFVICQAKDAARTVEALRSLGTVHVEHQQPPQSKDILALQEEIILASHALDVLSRVRLKTQAVPQKSARDWKLTCRHIVDLDKRLDQLKEYSCLLKVRIAEWEQWGDFDPDQIAALARKNIFIRLYQIPGRELDAVARGAIVRKIAHQGGIALCAVVSRRKSEISFPEVLPPKMSVSAMRQRLAQDKLVEQSLEKDLANHSDHYDDILSHCRMLEKSLAFLQAKEGMGAAGLLSYLAGYAPIDAIPEIEKAAKKNQWAIAVQEPGEEDAVPTLIRAPRWVRMISPVMRLLGITPGYRELDVSAFFLVFFSIFFGILIGDAGYGLIYLILVLWLQKKKGANPSVRAIAPLLYLLSCCAIAWGLITGTFFGQAWLMRRGIQGLDPVFNDPKFMQTFCFMLGALHLSLAHGWRAILKLPSLSALADFGWIGVLWAAFLLAKALILGDSFPPVGMWLLIVGVSLVVIFTNPQRNMLKAVGEGLGTVALSLMNNFTDVVSYVRLFAVGLAGVAIAETTNSMASGLGNGALAMAAGIAIVIIGHSLNVVLGPMSVLVHGVRLNVLEFSGHAGVSWSGTEYLPLKE